MPTQIVGGVPPFEEITLRLVEAEVPQALMVRGSLCDAHARVEP
jgi:hypothetical protein